MRFSLRRPAQPGPAAAEPSPAEPRTPSLQGSGNEAVATPRPPARRPRTKLTVRPPSRPARERSPGAATALAERLRTCSVPSPCGTYHRGGTGERAGTRGRAGCYQEDALKIGAAERNSWELKGAAAASVPAATGQGRLLLLPAETAEERRCQRGLRCQRAPGEALEAGRCQRCLRHRVLPAPSLCGSGRRCAQGCAGRREGSGSV